MTAVSNRPVPDGYTEEWDSAYWTTGFVFRWSKVYEAWLDCHVQITVKPGQSLSSAYFGHMDEPMWNDYTIFFV